MTDLIVPGVPVGGAEPPPPAAPDWRAVAADRRLRRRYARDRRFRLLGLAAVTVSIGFLLLLLAVIVAEGAGGFVRTEVALPIDLAAARLPIDPQRMNGPAADLALAGAGLEGAVDRAAVLAFGHDGDELLADQAWLVVRGAITRDPGLLDRRASFWLPVTSPVDLAYRGDSGPRDDVARVRRLAAHGVLRVRPNLPFLSGSDATDAASAGIWGALKGSLLTMAVTLLVACPVGVLAALYLEEFAPRGLWSTIIEVSISNLAAVPSIIFGLLGLAVMLGTFGLPRAAPLAAGLTLALMTMPVIVIAARGAIAAVSPSVRDAARSVGASPLQVSMHHVLPLAAPGILTGVILGLARALGEAAPLLLIGMQAFIVAPPAGLRDPATVLPVQIFQWSEASGQGFVEKAAAAVIVLLLLLLVLNGGALWLRQRMEARR